jgi:hypothetical protein
MVLLDESVLNETYVVVASDGIDATPPPDSIHQSAVEIEKYRRPIKDIRVDHIL